MAIQLSAYLWLRNNDFKQMTGHPSSRLKVKDRPKLKTILDELDRLHELSDMVDDDSVLIGPNPSVPNVVVNVKKRVLERSLDRKRSGELYLEIHKILRGNFVEASVYRRLQKAHEELSIEPLDDDFTKALQYGAELNNKRENWLRSTSRISGSGLKDYFCWNVELKRKTGPSFYKE